MAEEKTYEMLWDCKYCGTPKLLGLTHRFCPGCGAPQDQTARYFPADHEKVAVEDHVFAGADVLCPSCQEANGARAKHCRHCGGPLEGGAAVRTRAEQVHAVGQYAGETGAAGRAELQAQPVPASPEPKAKSRGGLLGALFGVGCLTVLVGAVALFAVFVLWKREAGVEVTGHAWERTIAVERYGKVKEQAWCDEKPNGAREISRTQAKRSTRQVEDGEECSIRKQDQGDGTFKEVKECRPKYRDEPVLSDRCTFEVLQWKLARTEVAKGSGLAPAPSWPASNLARTGTCEGCEREGARSEKYTVSFREAAKPAPFTCELPEPKWSSLKVGSRWKAKVHQLTGTLDCSALAPQ